MPDRPRTNTPRISSGEIWDIEVIPSLNRVFIAGNFYLDPEHHRHQHHHYNQANLAGHNLTTGW